MITDTCQRWTEGRESRRPAGEVIRPSAYDVAAIASDALARTFVELHHYSGTLSSASHRFGLYRHGELAGVAVFGVAPSMAAHAKVFPSFTLDEAVDLGRFVLVDAVPGNGESWFIARCFELLRLAGVAAVVSCADPQPRTTDAGRRIFPGHVGTIYQATNGCYIGRTNASTLRLLPDGRSFSNRACGKIARRERGHRYASAQFVRFGAEPLNDNEDALAWVQRWRALLTRPMRHRGNHRYVWCLDPKRRDEVIPKYGPVRAYPKLDKEAA